MSELARKLIAENIARHRRGEDATVLDLGCCGLSELPDISHLNWLRTLVVSNGWWNWQQPNEWVRSANTSAPNRLENLPAQHFPALLTTLVMSSDVLSKLGILDLRFLENLTGLTSLYLSENQISDISPLAKLEALTTLVLSKNQISDISPLSKLKALTTLVLSKNKISDISPLKDIFTLTSLHLNYNQVSDIYPLGKLPKLTKLYLAKNQISDLNPLSKLEALTSLVLSDNQISDLRPLENLTGLTSLDLSLNQISDISPLENHIGLTSLDLSYNQISDISPLVKLTGLTSLKLSSNQISDISSLNKFTELTLLDLNSNQIGDIYSLQPIIRKSVLVKLEPDLIGIILYNNPLSTPPPEIVKQGNEAILNWFAERSKQQFQNTEIKLILIGNSTAGKTSLSRYLRERIYTHGQPSTHGMQNYRWVPEGRKLEVNIWDFGGQEYYHATHRLFLSRNSVYALVWDAQTNAGGYCDTEIHYEHDPTPHQVRLEHFPHTWWLRNIRHYTRASNPPVPVLLVQNKCARDGIRRVSSDLEQPPYVLLPDCLDNIIDLAAVAEDAPEAARRTWTRRFEEFEERLLDKLEAQLTHYEFATYHRDIRDEVRRRAADGVNDMPYAAFEAMCRGFDEDAKMDLVRIYLHDITGDILYYPERPRLRERVFLRPDWVCNRIYAILSRQVLERQGVFDLAWVREALQCDAEEALDFVELMREFELIFDDSDEQGLPTGQYVAPQYLPDTCANSGELEGAKKYANLTHAFTLWFPDFLPKSHIARFVAYWGSQAQKRLFWKNGLLFITADCTVLVERVEGNRIRVDIQDKYPNREEAIRQVFHSFLKLEDGEAGFAVCMNGEDFVDWSAVREAVRTGARDVLCRSAAQDSQEYVPLSVFQTLLERANMVAIKIFFSYSKHDREEYLAPLLRYLRPLVRGRWLEPWDDSKILPGEEWDNRIKQEIERADIIMLLVSANSLDTDYIWNVEIEAAMRRHEEGTAWVIPVILTNCLWQEKGQDGKYIFPPAKLNALPFKGKPVSTWEDQNTAWYEVAEGIKKICALR